MTRKFLELVHGSLSISLLKQSKETWNVQQEYMYFLFPFS